MTDLSPARSPEHGNLTHAKWRKIVVKDKGLICLPDEGLYLLFIGSRAKSRDGKDLRLSAGEQARTVGPGKYTDLT